MIKQLILKVTHKMWNKEISRILCHLYGERVINSEQLHIIASKFDPTQEHEVY